MVVLELVCQDRVLALSCLNIPSENQVPLDTKAAMQANCLFIALKTRFESMAYEIIDLLQRLAR